MIGLYRRELMAQVLGRTAGTGAGPAAAVLTFEVHSVDETHEMLRQRGVKFDTQPTDRPDWFLRTAHFRDPDGNLIEIYENMPAGEQQGVTS
jgi:catechol 2,3-dioxygenase-like lactoylglutathione lyase family enzyme